MWEGFSNLVTIFGCEKKVSTKGKTYFVVAIDKGIDVLKLYCPLPEKDMPQLTRGEQVEIFIDIDNYGKPVVNKIVK